MTQMVQNMSAKLKKKNATPTQPKTQQRRKRQAPAIPGTSARAGGQDSGIFSLRHMEYLLELKTDAKGGYSSLVSFRPGGTNNDAGYIAAQAKIHERMRWNTLKVEYVGTVGTTEGGIVAFGVDWLNSAKTIDIKHIVGLTPNKQCAVWDKAVMSVPVAKMRAQQWLATDDTKEASHGALAVVVNGAEAKVQVVGYIRITYDVTFAGTRLP